MAVSPCSLALPGCALLPRKSSWVSQHTWLCSPENLIPIVFCACAGVAQAPAMTLPMCEPHLRASPGAAGAGPPGRLTGIALMTGSAASNHVGAATAALAFPALGPAGVVAVRQWVAGALLLAAARPKFAS